MVGQSAQITLSVSARITMLRTLDNLETGPSQPSTALPYGVFNRGMTSLATGATRPSNMMGQAMRALDDMVIGSVSFPGGGGGYGNAPQTYLSNAALNYTLYGKSLSGIRALPTPGTMVWVKQDSNRERSGRSRFGMLAQHAHYPGIRGGGMNKKAHPVATPEALNYYLLHRQLAQFKLDQLNGVPYQNLVPIEVADEFSLDGICISSTEVMGHSTQTLTWQGRANYVNNFGITELPRAAKIYTVFKRTPKKKIPKSFCLSPYMNKAEQGHVQMNASADLSLADETFTPVMAYPVVLADGSRLTPEYLIDKDNVGDAAAFYLGHVFHNEDYNPQRFSSYGKSTDPKEMLPFSDAGNANDRGLLEINVELHRVR